MKSVLLGVGFWLGLIGTHALASEVSEWQEVYGPGRPRETIQNSSIPGISEGFRDRMIDDCAREAKYVRGAIQSRAVFQSCERISNGIWCKASHCETKVIN